MKSSKIYSEINLLNLILYYTYTLFNDLMYRFSSNVMDIDDYVDKCHDHLNCIKEDISAKNNYNEMNFGQFWISVINSYPDLLHLLMKYLLPFGSTYMYLNEPFQTC